MTRQRKLEALASVSAFALIALMEPASAATITVVGTPETWSSGVAPTGPFSLLPLGTATTGNSLQTSATQNVDGVTINFNTGSNPASGVYAGNSSGNFSSPYGSGNGNTNYLLAGGANGTSASQGMVTVTYSTPQTSLDLLWGTIDTATSSSGARNEISITVDGVTITGAQIQAAYSADGYTGFSSSNTQAYVEITGLAPFTTATFTDNSKPAFEFNLGVPTATPLPAALPLFAGGVGLLGLLGRRRKRKAA